MTTFDLSPLWRSSVGFDEFDRLFDSVFSTNNKGSSYPPYNIVKHDKNIYQITMAIAGFDQEQINISQEGNLLTVKVSIGNTSIQKFCFIIFFIRFHISFDR